MTNPYQVRVRLRAVAQGEVGAWEATRGIKGAITGYLNKFLGGDDHRYLVLGFLFGGGVDPIIKRSGELSETEWYALYQWLDFAEGPDGKWLVSQLFHDEIMPIFTEAVRCFNDAEYYRQYYVEGIDPLDMMPTAVELGGEIKSITQVKDRAAATVERPKPAPTLLGSTRFGRFRQDNALSQERQKQILTELGYDDPEDPLVNF